MGRYDDISDERLRAELTRAARLVLRMEEEGVLLERTASVLRLLGELRQMVFAFEVRSTRRDQPPRPHPRSLRARARPSGAEPEDEELHDSMRIVREALEREREFLDRLEDRPGEPDDPARS
jgi:hypothetical protein